MTRDHFVEFVRAARQGVVATVDVHGDPEAALVGLAVNDAAEVIFDSLSGARKVHNVRAHPRVALVIGCDGGVSVQVEGVADILAGSVRDKYGAIYLSQFPGARALNDELSIVRVVPLWTRYYDARQAPALVLEGECW
jgi:antitoxin (DNA-binding transcriptional repressor) of toxin-antitoxin stability system